jgi:hypothetical protein
MRTRRLSRFVIWFNARRDRRHNVPAPNATALSAMEQRIQAAVNLQVRSLQAVYVKAAEGPKARLTAAVDELRRDHRPEFDRHVEKTGRRQEHVSLTSRMHSALMTALTLGEAAFNVVVFAVFREATIFSILMALAVAVAIPVLAYNTGVALRQYEPLGRKLRWVLTLSFIAVITLGGINWIRVTYLRARPTTIAVDDSTLTICYFLINLSVFAAACLVTYASKDPVTGFVEAKNTVEARQAEIAKLRGRLNTLAAQLVHDVQLAHEAGHQVIAYYRGVNRRGRLEVPKYFDDESAVNHRVKFADVTPERFDEGQQESNSPVSADEPKREPRTLKPVVRLRGII